MTGTPLHALSWFGGKSMLSNQGIGRWLLGLLPPVAPGQTYVEAYAGMLSVLLARPPAYNEVANDLDSRVYNFWYVLREQPDQLHRLLTDTPHCEQTYRLAQTLVRLPIRTPPDIDAAWAFVVSVGQAVMSVVEGAGWKTQRGYARDSTHRPEHIAHRWRTKATNLTAGALSERIRNVSLQHKDGAQVAGYYADNPHAVIYCDPPYTQGAYGYSATANPADLMAAVVDAKARVLISGYTTDPYDELGWHRYERDVLVDVATERRGKQWRERTECAWCNYDAEQLGSSDPQLVLL